MGSERAHQIDIWWAHFGEGLKDEQLLEVAPVCTHVDTAIRRVLLQNPKLTYSISTGLVEIESHEGTRSRVGFDPTSAQSLAMAIVKAGILVNLPVRSESLDNRSSTRDGSSGGDGGSE